MGPSRDRLDRIDDRAGVQPFARFASAFGGPWNFLGGVGFVITGIVLAACGTPGGLPLIVMGVVAIAVGLFIGPPGMLRSWFGLPRR